ncbi:hypothetical protein RRG08_035003 [Elysia crispata]|uniref:G-protein coupled receptors family 1 profile domain-containing protein n=1 Tax=Elysia crispata TaxID=231223 RepID=A0AAE0ZSM7_9GAST|nr:hypothetical protein RRG08_035003 [Elysia crispata]
MVKGKGSFNQTSMSSDTTIPQTSARVGCINRTIGDDGTLAFFAVFIGFVLLCENLLLINLIVRTRSLHTNTNILVASLAITDVLVGALVCVMGLCEQREGLRSWLDLTPDEIRIFDTFLAGLKFSLAIVSICHLSVLTLDRYLNVLWPLHYHLRVTRRRVVATATLLWTIGLVYFSFALIIFRSPEHHRDCIIWNTPAEYGVWPFGVVYLICVFIVFASTIGIAKIAMEHKQRRQLKLPTRNKTPSFSKKSPRKRNRFETGCMMVKSPTQTWQLSESNCVLNNISSSINMKDVTNMPPEDTGRSGIPVFVNTDCHKIDLKFNTNATLVTFNSNKNFDNYDATDKKCTGSNLTVSVGHQQARNVSARFGKCQQGRNFERLSVAGVFHCKKAPRSKNSADIKNIRENEVIATSNNCSYSSAPFAETRKELVPDHIARTKKKSNKQVEHVKIFSKENIKIIKFVIVVCGCFLSCTFIPLVIFLIKSFYPALPFPKYIVPAMFIMFESNSGMNFFIITFMNKDFRSALIRILPCRRVLCLEEMR